MKRLAMATVVVAMFLGTSAFAGDKTMPQTSTGKATTENVLHAGKKAKKMHKKHHAKKMKKAASKAAPAKK